jgi:galactofuranosylgalactofuranosylrhamnosyl-N-acetylglucosaminyl-diphospho-decaprenol beta-1,5/1,6-galactofuranosyltransferase
MSTAEAIKFRRIPVTPAQIGKTLVKAIAHNATSVSPESRTVPQLNLPFQDAQWFLLSRLDSATVGTADGRGVTFRRREPDTFWRMLRHSVRVHWTLYREFPRLRAEYREHLGELTSPESWSKAFGEGTPVR